jgi:hypothetical protein
MGLAEGLQSSVVAEATGRKSRAASFLLGLHGDFVSFPLVTQESLPPLVSTDGWKAAHPTPVCAPRQQGSEVDGSLGLAISANGELNVTDE